MTITDVGLLLLDDAGQRPVERRVGAADEFFQLILPHAIDEEAERGHVAPRRHDLAERLQVAPRLLDVHQLRGVLAQLVQESVDLAEVVDLLAGDLGQHPLVVGGRRRQEPLVHVKMRPADLAIGLDAEHALEERLILLRHLRHVGGFDLVGERPLGGHEEDPFP